MKEAGGKIIYSFRYLLYYDWQQLMRNCFSYIAGPEMQKSQMCHGLFLRNILWHMCCSQIYLALFSTPIPVFLYYHFVYYLYPHLVMILTIMGIIINIEAMYLNSLHLKWILIYEINCTRVGTLNQQGFLYQIH